MYTKAPIFGCFFVFIHPKKRSPTWEKPDFNIVPGRIRASQQCRDKDMIKSENPADARKNCFYPIQNRHTFQV